MYQAIVFFDLDGTLFDNQKELLPSSLSAIDELRETNILPVISTGRNIFEVQYVLNETGIDSIISANGSYVVYAGSKLFAEELSKTDLAEITDYANAQGDPVAYFNSHEFRLSQQTDVTKENYKLLRLNPIVDDDWYKTHEVNFLNIFNSNKEEQYNAHFKGKFSLVRNNPRCLDTMKYGVSKQTGIQQMIKYAGLEGIKTYAFGDQLNDLQMFDQVDVPIVMENGNPEAKKKAAYVTTSNENDGIANGLRHFGLIR
ncbi:Cof-type HAD-IIB family hydrolase [Levilactobacillus bambusae]|uniref:Cof-type HAD-IIB family hydrolase n=1 Tax=Levilactobacillus bambusae TaxID=2024736 RepID=A0A2V1N282_9LACO|nr:Cof-type HAD-IIB family hydrolase [Levilactobacillus bambusae]PWG01082.1 Cof-type HAD-IIB family hydrolase [Levilactobacillus bambusae]